MRFNNVFWFHACELGRHVAEEEVKQEQGDKSSKWDKNVWCNDPSVWGDCLISKHHNHKFTNLLHMLYPLPPDLTSRAVKSRCEADTYQCFFAVDGWTGAFGDHFVYAFFVNGRIAL